MKGFLALSLLLCMLASSAVTAEDDFRMGALKNQAPPSLPGKVTGLLWQDEKNGPLRFSLDLYVVPNVYWEDPTQNRDGDFQVDAKGGKIPLRHGFRSMRAADLGQDRPRYALVELEVNQGRGMQGLNGMLVSRVRRLDKGLSQSVAALDRDVDRIAAGYRERIQSFFKQKCSGRDLHLVQPTWLSDAQAIQVRQARSVTGRHLDGGSRTGRHLQIWEVPYLTVCYHIRPDGGRISRKVVAPRDPISTAREYNPAGSPW